MPWAEARALAFTSWTFAAAENSGETPGMWRRVKASGQQAPQDELDDTHCVGAWREGHPETESHGRTPG